MQEKTCGLIWSKRWFYWVLLQGWQIWLNILKSKYCFLSVHHLVLVSHVKSQYNALKCVVLTGKDALTLSRKANTFARPCQWLLWCCGPARNANMGNFDFDSLLVKDSTIIILLQSLLTMRPVSSQDNRRRNLKYGSGGYRFPCCTQSRVVSCFVLHLFQVFAENSFAVLSSEKGTGGSNVLHRHIWVPRIPGGSKKQN